MCIRFQSEADERTSLTVAGVRAGARVQNAELAILVIEGALGEGFQRLLHLRYDTARSSQQQTWLIGDAFFQASNELFQATNMKTDHSNEEIGPHLGILNAVPAKSECDGDRVW